MFNEHRVLEDWQQVASSHPQLTSVVPEIFFDVFVGTALARGHKGQYPAVDE
jgi:hypothetical protein